MTEMINPRRKALAEAVRRGDKAEILRETERMMQAMANDLSAVSRRYGQEFHGIMLVVADSFAASLRILADETDLKIAEELGRKSEAVTIGVRTGKGGGRT